MLKSISDRVQFTPSYNPIIQLFLSIVGFLFLYNQISLVQKQVNLQKLDFEKRLNPSFTFKLNSSENNRINDNFELDIKGESISLSNYSLFFLNYAELEQTVVYDKILTVNNLKNVLSNYPELWNEITNVYLTHYQSNVLNYPVILDFNYVQLNETKNLRALYNYVFKAYDFNGKVEIRSLDLEFVEILEKGLNPKNVLIKYCVEEAIPFGSNNFQELLILNSVKSDEKYKKLIEYIDLNRRFNNYIQLYINEKDNEDKTVVNFPIPAFIGNDSLISKRNVLVKSILEEKEYNEIVLKTVRQIEDSLLAYPIKQTIDFSKKQKDTIFLLSNTQENWMSLQSKLLDLIIETYQIK